VKLRRIPVALLFVVPTVCSGLLVVSAPVRGIVFGALAVASATLGVLTERWLFFAEAEHVAMLYYGSEIA
jgi:DMSO reductase anchor subunit